MPKRLSIGLGAIIFMSSLITMGMTDNGLKWERRSNGLNGAVVHRLAGHPHGASTLYAGTDKGVFVSKNAGKDFQLLGGTQNIASQFFDIHIPAPSPDIIYLATDQGLYKGNIKGRSAQIERIFYSSDTNERACLSVLGFEGALYVGTRGGIFYKEKEGGSWPRLEGVPGNEAVPFIKADGHYLYIATNSRVYRFDRARQAVQEIFSAGILSEDDEIFFEEGEEDPGQPAISGAIRSLTVTQGTIIAGTSRGIYVSSNEGRRWDPVPARTLSLNDLTQIIVHGHGLVASTRKGVFLYEGKAWVALYQGMGTNAVNDLARAEDGIYAATDRGVFALSPAAGEQSPVSNRQSPGGSDQAALVNRRLSTGDGRLFSDEPTIRQVHAWAVDHAEVHPDKIKEWRRLARKRAWLPSLDIGFDTGRDWDYSDSVFGTSSSGGSYYIAPDDKSYGRDVGFDVSMSWDLGDLVWSSDQTSIDSRSKLMVELREEILDQVTRIYFERRRMQVEQGEELRIEELTALLDAFTGGKFSEAMDSR